MCRPTSGKRRAARRVQPDVDAVLRAAKFDPPGVRGET